MLAVRAHRDARGALDAEARATAIRARERLDAAGRREGAGRGVAREPCDAVRGVRRDVDVPAVGADGEAARAEQRVAVDAEAIRAGPPIAAAIAHAADGAQCAGVAGAREGHDPVRAARGRDVDVAVVRADGDGGGAQQPPRPCAVLQRILIERQRRLLGHAPTLPRELRKARGRSLGERRGRRRDTTSSRDVSNRRMLPPRVISARTLSQSRSSGIRRVESGNTKLWPIERRRSLGTV